jgi:VacB/RNase II family 3'-5' exoribonuclease
LGVFDLAAVAREEMIAHGFDPDFPPGVARQVAEFKAQPVSSDNIRDLRQLLWSSIDNDTSRDLDQAEVAERVNGGIRVMVAIADVDYGIAIGSPIDQHAAGQTTTVYTGVRNFSMLPEELSTDLTSLNENADRLAVVVDMMVAADGSISSASIHRALIRNHAQLTYTGVGAWLEGTAAAPPKVAASADLQNQLRLQDEAAHALRSARYRLGALNFDRVEAEAVVTDSHVQSFTARKRNRATALIEDFMIGANEMMAQTLKRCGCSSIRRVVKSPERWPRIVELAARHGEKLPPKPDSAALNAFLSKMRKTDEVHYADLSLAVVKLMGPGEYVLARPDAEDQGHFALAVHDYTHSTAPNRRFADMVTQRLVKSILSKRPAPYADPQLDSIARNCTLKEDAARKVERVMAKRIAALALSDRVGEAFNAVVTGDSPKGVFVRVLAPPVEGMLVHGQQGVDVGDQIRVKLVGTDPRRGFIDFSRV